MNKPILFLLLLGILSCKSHQGKPQPEIIVSVIDDATDSFLLRPAAPILQLYQFQASVRGAAAFRFTAITDMELTPVQQLYLPDADSSERLNKNDEITNREMVVRAFCDSVRASIMRSTEYVNGGTSKGHSECFESISRELTYLSHKPSATRTLIIYGDLLENSQYFSCYTADGYRRLTEHPEQVIQLFESLHKLPMRLDGITVVLIYKPTTRTHDRVYSAISSVYASLLEKRNAKVFIQSQNETYDLQ
jgi:hypothetical protein